MASYPLTSRSYPILWYLVPGALWYPLVQTVEKNFEEKISLSFSIYPTGTWYW